MVFDPKIMQGEILNNEQLCDIFKCGIRSGMRKSNSTKTMVLVSDHTRGVYTDIWEGKILHYTGMGLEGAQKLSRENKILYESPKTQIDLHLFEVFLAGEYVYQGRVMLAGKPYESRQGDRYGKSRTVWVFPLRLVGEKQSFVMPEALAIKEQEFREKRASKLSVQELRKRINRPTRRRQNRYVLIRQYVRDENVAECVRRNANGLCELCENIAPFNRLDGQPFLEIHHIKWLSQGGEDTIKNAVALCPNCHRKMHMLNLKVDRDHLVRRALSHSI